MRALAWLVLQQARTKLTLRAFRTLTVPKPLVEFCNKPMIVHQIEVREFSLAVQQDSLHSSKLRATPNRYAYFYTQALKSAGVTEVILAINYRPEVRLKLDWDCRCQRLRTGARRLSSDRSLHHDRSS
jgi:hypothetical protein